MTEKPWRDKNLLQELYWEEGLSCSEIGEELGCSHNTIHRWLKRHDIDTRTAPYDRPPCFHTDDSGYENWRHEIGDKEEQHRVRVHRLLAVAEYGFEAVKNKDVHHVNRIPWDNRSSNIIPLSKEEHRSIHNSTEMTTA